MSRDNINPGLIAWLGPAAEEMTDEQVERFAAISRDVDRRYPDVDEQPMRDAALGAAVQYMLGETTPEDARRALGEARMAEACASAASQQIAVMLVEEGTYEIPAAEAVGISRPTLRRALGKRTA